MQQNLKVPRERVAKNHSILDEVDRILIQRNLSHLRKTVMGSIHHSSGATHLKTLPARAVVTGKSRSRSSWRFWVGLVATALMVSGVGVKLIDHFHHDRLRRSQHYTEVKQGDKTVRYQRSRQHAAKAEAKKAAPERPQVQSGIQKFE